MAHLGELVVLPLFRVLFGDRLLILHERLLDHVRAGIIIVLAPFDDHLKLFAVKVLLDVVILLRKPVAARPTDETVFDPHLEEIDPVAADRTIICHNVPADWFSAL